MLSIEQRQLNLYHIGYFYTGKIDEIEGPKTRNAYREFQESQKLKITGKYNKETETALMEFVKDVQKALIKAGFPLPKYGADGKVGEETINAIEAFQKAHGLVVDSIAGPKTFDKFDLFLKPEKSVDWTKSKYFQRKEFLCPCKHCNGFPVEPHPVLVALLNRARDHFDLPIHLTSAVRCAWQNEHVGGIKNSKHRQGKAADCSLDFNSDNDLKLKKWFMQQPEVSYTYTGFGAVHVDVK